MLRPPQRLLRAGPASIPSFGGKPTTDAFGILGVMIVRRDGSIDLRVLLGRALSYGAVTMLALAVGALIAFAT